MTDDFFEELMYNLSNDIVVNNAFSCFSHNFCKYRYEIPEETYSQNKTSSEDFDDADFIFGLF